MLKKKIVILGISTLLISIVFIFVILNDNKHLPSATVGSKLDPIKGYLVDDIKKGKILLNSELNNEKFLINIFSSWCAPCRDEHKYLLKFKNSNIKIIGVNYKDSKKNMSSFLNELGNPYYAIVDDKDGYQSIKLGAFGVPETFLIDKKKNIVLKQIGPIDDNIYFKFLEILKK